MKAIIDEKTRIIKHVSKDAEPILKDGELAVEIEHPVSVSDGLKVTEEGSIEPLTDAEMKKDDVSKQLLLNALIVARDDTMVSDSMRNVCKMLIKYFERN